MLSLVLPGQVVSDRGRRWLTRAEALVCTGGRLYHTHERRSCLALPERRPAIVCGSVWRCVVGWALYAPHAAAGARGVGGDLAD